MVCKTKLKRHWRVRSIAQFGNSRQTELPEFDLGAFGLQFDLTLRRRTFCAVIDQVAVDADFDGVDDYAVVPHAPALNLTLLENCVQIRKPRVREQQVWTYRYAAAQSSYVPPKPKRRTFAGAPSS